MEEGVPPLGQMLAKPDPGADAGVEGDYREDQTNNFQQHAAAGLHWNRPRHQWANVRVIGSFQGSGRLDNGETKN
jgi:hypothetical protein